MFSEYGFTNILNTIIMIWIIVFIIILIIVFFRAVLILIIAFIFVLISIEYVSDEYIVICGIELIFV